ncbi:hypothetical protein EG327_007788 [Venturia inaequalis]|uniref:Uncharacterized protein n=1 Tax=Venturia inaequalis TaxID=5025 RepID=A0A8H3Z1E4_VENIN|nr:hypothetical protein EG327_007788 [Venturia inaequalis]
MRLQILVPAILFTRSKVGVNKASNILTSEGLLIEEYSPAPSFVYYNIAAIKAGKSCADWKFQIVRGCNLYLPYNYLGPVDGKECAT